jgi:hypothetical protein
MKNITKTIALLILPLISLTYRVTPTFAETDSSHYSTDWKVVKFSMTDLLNDGWQIVTQSSHRSVLVNSNGTIGMDEQKILYTLHKDRKYITCILQNPKLSGSVSGCRYLN